MLLGRLLRVLALLVAATLATAALVLAAAIAALHTAPGQRFAVAQLATLLAGATGARVSLGAIDGNLVRTVVVGDLRMAFRRGTALSVRRARVRWRPWVLLFGRVRVLELAVDGLQLRATRDGDGWGIPTDAGAEGPDAEAGGPVVEIDAIRVRDARVAVALRDRPEPRRIALANLELDGRFRLAPGALVAELHRLAAVPRGVGVTPLEAAGRVRLAGDLVEVEGLRLATRRTQIRGEARVTPGRQAVVHLAALPLDAGEVRALLPELALARDVRVQAGVAGPWHDLGVTATADLGDGGRLLLRGAIDLDADPLHHRARLKLDDVDPSAVLATLPSGRLRGAAGIAGRGTDLHADATYRLALEDSVLAGRDVRRVRLVGAMAGGRHDLRLRAALHTASAALRGEAVLEPVLAWRTRGRVVVDDLATLLDGTPGRIRASLDGSGRGTAPETRHASVHLTLRDSEVRGVRVDDGVVHATVDGTALSLAGIRLHGPTFLVEGDAAADLAARRLDVTLQASADLEAVRPAPAGGLGGRAVAGAAVRGSWDALEADAHVEVAGLRVGSVTAARARLDGRAARLGGPIPSATVTLALQSLRLTDGAPWSGSADLGWDRRTGVDAVRVAGSGHADGGGVLDLGLAAWREPASTSVRLERLVLAVPGGERWALVAPARATVAADGRVDLPWLAVAAGTQRMTVSGQAGPTGPADGTVQLAAIALAPLCVQIGRVRCDGRVSGDLRVEGTAAAPRVQAALRVPGLQIDDARYGELAVRASYAGRRLDVDADLQRPEAGVLELTGSVPVDLAWDGPRADLRGTPLSLRLHAERLDLRFVPALAPTVVRELDGRLSADLRLEGPRDALAPSGTVDLRATRLLLAATGVPWEDVVARLRADAGGVTVERLSVRGGEGRMTGDGRVALRGGLPDAVALRVALEDFLAVQVPAYEAAVDGALALEGTVAAPRVTGTLDVDRALVRPGMLPTSTPDLTPDPTIEVVGLPPAPDAGREAGAVDLADALALGIRVTVARNAWIRRTDAQIELRGDLRVDKAPAGPVTVTGTVRLVRGWYAFQGRRFELDEGTIVFSGQSPPDPTFEILASHRTPDYRVIIRVAGTASHPTLELSSDPPLEQADVLAVLLFGKPAGDLGRGESLDLQRQAVSLASGYVMPELQTSVMETLGLDTLDVGAEAVRAGRYVTDDVFVSIAQEFGSQPGQSVSVEYSLTPRVSVKASTATTGRSAIDLQWRHRY